MIYIEDKNFEYKDEMLNELRTYNSKHTGQKDSSIEFFYALEGEKLVGSLYTKCFWDWVKFDHMFYENVDVLKKLFSEASQFYKNKAVGMKYYTAVQSRVEDFQSIGFEIAGITENTPKTSKYFYLKNTDFNIKSHAETEIIVRHEIIDQYHTILLEQEETFNQENKIYPLEENHMMFVALDDNQFVGAVHGTITEDSMYIGWLVVKEKYKGQGIGSNLMQKMEKVAKEQNIYSIHLGTTGFQARKFYEKLGYKIFLIKENDPKGYNTYSMAKKL